MPSIFSICKDHQEEPYVRPSFHEFARTDSIDSDATAPNNPGPGRTIGLLFNAVGTKIERFLNQTAARRGLGPQAIVDDIRGLQRVRFTREKSLWSANRERPTKVPFTEQECACLKRRCRKLLKYCRSQVLETQLEALKAITTFAVEDPYVRQVLAGILHRKYLIPKYKEPELCIQSFRALISVKENEVYDFFKYLIKNTHLLKRGPRECRLLNRLESFLRNPDVSFLLQRLMHYRCNDCEMLIFNTYIHVASTNPHVVEWETLRGCVSWLKYYIRTFSIDDVMRLARYFPIFHEYRGRTTGSDPGEDGSPNLKEFVKESFPVLEFLRCLCGTEDLATQLQFLRDLDEDTRRLFQGTVFNEIHIALAHACHANLTGVTCLETAAVVLIRYYLSGHPNQQALAKEAIILSMESGRYFKIALAAACQSNDVCDVDMPSESLKLSKGKSSSCGFDIVNRRLFQRNFDIEPAGEDTGMCKNDMLYSETWKDFFSFTCWLEVRGDEYPFDVTGHFPVLAGYDTSGKELYIAQIVLEGQPYEAYVYVSDGARSLSISDCNGKVRVLNRFSVMVLRHDPCDSGVMNIPEDAKFQTGPVYWMRCGGEEWEKVTDTFAMQLRLIWADDGQDWFEDVTESDSQEVTNLGSNENIWGGLEVVRSYANSDAVHEQGIWKADKLGGRPQLIDNTRRLDSDSERSSNETTENMSSKIDLEALFKVPVTDEGVERGLVADVDLGVVEEAGAGVDGSYRLGDIQQIHPDDEHYIRVLEEGQRQIEEERQLLVDRMRKLDERERELNKIRALKLQLEDSRSPV